MIPPEFIWQCHTRNSYSCDLGDGLTIAVRRPQRLTRDTRQPFPWRVELFGSPHVTLAAGDVENRFDDRDDAMRAAEREVLHRLRSIVVRLGGSFRGERHTR